jgi:hypothetical protein
VWWLVKRAQKCICVMTGHELNVGADKAAFNCCCMSSVCPVLACAQSGVCLLYSCAAYAYHAAHCSSAAASYVSRLTDQQLGDNLLLIMLAGHDTSSTTLTNVMANLQVRRGSSSTGAACTHRSCLSFCLCSSSL